MADLIDRQAAKEKLVKTCNDVADKLYEWEGCSGYCDIVIGIADCLDDIPAAQPQRMRGRWEEVDGWDGDVIYQCSECKEEFVLVDGTPQDNLYHYCPNCGSYNGGEE